MNSYLKLLKIVEKRKGKGVIVFCWWYTFDIQRKDTLYGK